MAGGSGPRRRRACSCRIRNMFVAMLQAPLSPCWRGNQPARAPRPWRRTSRPGQKGRRRGGGRAVRHGPPGSARPWRRAAAPWPCRHPGPQPARAPHQGAGREVGLPCTAHRLPAPSRAAPWSLLLRLRSLIGHADFPVGSCRETGPNGAGMPAFRNAPGAADEPKPKPFPVFSRSSGKWAAARAETGSPQTASPTIQSAVGAQVSALRPPALENAAFCGLSVRVAW